MNPLLLRLIGLGILTLIGTEVFNSKRKFNISKNSNCDEIFKEFNRAIEISSEKKAKLRRAHNTIRKILTEHFIQNTNLPLPNFWIQGSYKMNTMVENINTKCDVDLGVFFPSKPKVSIPTIQQNIKNGLSNHTRKGISIKPNCVRLNYVMDFHIDMPIYYESDWDGVTYFAKGGSEWEPSDPKGFIRWFEEKNHNNKQLTRVVRYFKAWADFIKVNNGRKMPSGLALTLWAAKFYERDTRDDLAFLKTVVGILDYLNNSFQYNWKAEMPVSPYDNVLDRLDDSQKTFFYDQLTKMVSYGTNAVSCENSYDASRNWSKIFGDRFG